MNVKISVKDKKISNSLSERIEILEKVYQRNKDELKSDGVILKSAKEFLNRLNVQLETLKGKTIFTFKNGYNLEVHNRGLKMFPRRAILRIGMLLRDSEVAKELRTQLLILKNELLRNKKL